MAFKKRPQRGEKRWFLPVAHQGLNGPKTFGMGAEET